VGFFHSFFTERSGDIVYALGQKGCLRVAESSLLLQIDITEIVVHKAH